jgi:L-lactate dehydrogenase complex protein LldG
MSSRDAILERVRQAVAAGNRPGEAAEPIPQRGQVGYQGAGPDAIRRFCDELKAAGGQPHLAADRATACHILLDLVRSRSGRKALLSRCDILERLDIAAQLRAAGIEVAIADDLTSRGMSEANPAGNSARDTIFAADIGVSGVYRLVAETGTVVMAASPQQPRSVSLLPPVHIAIAEASQLLPDLFDLFDLFSPVPSAGQSLPPSCLTLITGPSKTGDIELRLVTGVHGPGEIHVILLTQ